MLSVAHMCCQTGQIDNWVNECLSRCSVLAKVIGGNNHTRPQPHLDKVILGHSHTLTQPPLDSHLGIVTSGHSQRWTQSLLAVVTSGNSHSRSRRDPLALAWAPLGTLRPLTQVPVGIPVPLTSLASRTRARKARSSKVSRKRARHTAW